MNLGTEIIRKFKMTVPPTNEQDEIVALLDSETEAIEALFQRVERSLALLTERRAALITAAVTGQIDVRAEQPASTLEPQ